MICVSCGREHDGITAECPECLEERFPLVRTEQEEEDRWESVWV